MVLLYSTQVDRRYSWMKRTLLKYEEESSAIFPHEWSMPERLCVEFCHMTKYVYVFVLINMYFMYNLCMYVITYVCTYVCMYITDACIYIYIYIYIYMYLYMYGYK